MLTSHDNFSCKLEFFEGPIDYLLYLVQKREIDPLETPISEIAQQFSAELNDYLSGSLEVGADFLAIAAQLMLIKSRNLLPPEEGDSFEEELDPKFEVIHKLLEYSEFKQLAKVFSEREESHIAFYQRGDTFETGKIEKPHGLEHLSLEDISLQFEKVLEKETLRFSTIDEEEWRVPDLMEFLRLELIKRSKIPFSDYFSPAKSRDHLIVSFLALLELMKLQTATVARDLSTNLVYILQSNQESSEDEPGN